MSQQERLEKAIASFEAQRSLLGDDVVDTTVSALREHLAALLRERQREQRKLITVLVADLSGYTAMAEKMDVEEVRDTMNALWQRLDAVAVRWDGHVDKHVGDALITLFGAPRAQEDDPQRAVAAGLAMQEAMSAFIEEDEARSGLALRIGVHTGRALLSPALRSGEYTAVGETVNLAVRLEEMAPLNSVLISHDVYRHVDGLFDVVAGTHVPLPGIAKGLPTYRVTGERARRTHASGRGIAGVGTPMVGRDEELDKMRAGLERVFHTGRGELLMVVGEAGIGKSRLGLEFKQWLREKSRLPGQVTLVEARADRQMRRLPYSLLRELVAAYCGIRDSDQPLLARQKLVAALERAAAVREAPEEGGGLRAEYIRRAHFIGQLIGLDFSDSPYLQGMIHDARQIRQRAFAHLAKLFQETSSDQMSVLLLEDVHWADEGSLDLIAHLMQECVQARLLIICLARPSLFERRPAWRDGTRVAMAHMRLELLPLCEKDSQRLLQEILRPSPTVPRQLLQLVTMGAEGNPFFIEELVKMFIEEGVIVREGGGWRFHMQGAVLGVPATLTGVLQARLDRLPRGERHLLQRAAVIGFTFWEEALQAQAPGEADSLQERLTALVEKELILESETSAFAQTREYTFKHVLLREVIYESVLLRRRRQYHLRVAGWLSRQSGARAEEYAAIIAEHYETAGELPQAGGWYARAAAQAQAGYAPEAAIGYYRKALSFLPPDTAPERKVALYHGLGEMLRWQARFDEAVEAFGAMRLAAERAGDLLAQANAWRGLFLAHDYQGEHRAALRSAVGAERVARALGSPAELSMALSSKGWALMFLGEVERALDLAFEAKALAIQASSREKQAFSYLLLGGVYRVLRRYEESEQASQRALILFQELGERIWEGLLLHNLGQTARLQGDYTRARGYYSEAVAIAHEVGDRYGAMSSLSRLGRVARLQGAYRQAEAYHRGALELAERSHNSGRLAYIAHDLGDLYLAQAVVAPTPGRQEQLQRARQWFEEAARRAEEAGQEVTLAAARVGLAHVVLEGEGPAQALPLAADALEIARMQVALWQGIAAKKVVGTAWWLLGLVAAQLPLTAFPLLLEGRTCDTAACFARSLQTWDEIGSGVAWERARALRDWAAYELRAGDAERGQQMQEEAISIFTRLGTVQEVVHLDHQSVVPGTRERASG